MKTNRGRSHQWNKPFKLFFSKQQFDNLETTEYCQPHEQTNKTTLPSSKKEEIIIPQIRVVQRITKPKKFAKIQPNYIRITPQLNLPNLKSYELNEVDHVFLQSYTAKYKLGGKPVLTEEFLSGVIVELQKRAGKDPIFPRKKVWMNEYLQKHHNSLLRMNNYENFTDLLYSYWKNRREELGFPMLRSLWRPNREQCGYLLAFKARDKEKDKRITRKAPRVNEQEIVEGLQQEFALACKLAQRVKARQQLGIKKLQLEFTSFHNQCSQLFEDSKQQNLFFTPFKPESMNKDKQKIKSFRNQVEHAKKTNQESPSSDEQEVIAQQPSFNKTKTLGNFLSTVVSLANEHNVNYETIFQEKKLGLHKLYSPSPIVVQQDLTLQDSSKKEENKEKGQFLQIALYRDKQTIYRVLEDIQSSDDINDSAENYGGDNKKKNADNFGNKQRIFPPKTLEEYYKKRLNCYLFGEQDQGENDKGLGTTIAQNFKKYKNFMKS